MTNNTDRAIPRTSDTPSIPTTLPAAAVPVTNARFGIGEIVRHRIFPFRGVVFDVDPEFANTEEWWNAIPEHLRPAKDQPYYHLLAENDEDAAYIAYVSQQNLEREEHAKPVHHPAVLQLFEGFRDGRYRLRPVCRQ